MDFLYLFIEILFGFKDDKTSGKEERKKSFWQSVLKAGKFNCYRR